MKSEISVGVVELDEQLCLGEPLARRLVAADDLSRESSQCQHGNQNREQTRVMYASGHAMPPALV